MKQASNCWAESAAQASCRGGRTVDGTEDFRGRGSVGEKNSSSRECDDMQRDFADQSDVGSGSLELFGQEDKVRDHEVERRPNEQHETENSQCSKVTNNEWEQPQLRDHGIDALNRQHEADFTRSQSQTTGKFEGKHDIVVRLGGAQEDGHELVEGDTVAVVQKSASEEWRGGREVGNERGLTMQECHRQ